MVSANSTRQKIWSGHELLTSLVLDNYEKNDTTSTQSASSGSWHKEGGRFVGTLGGQHKLAMTPVPQGRTKATPSVDARPRRLPARTEQPNCDTNSWHGGQDFLGRKVHTLAHSCVFRRFRTPSPEFSDAVSEAA